MRERISDGKMSDQGARLGQVSGQVSSQVSGRLARTSGAAALVAALVFGPAIGFGQTAQQKAPGARSPAEPRQTAQPAHVSAAGAQAAAPAENKTDANIIARVGSDSLTADEIRAYVGTLDSREQAALARDPALLSQAVRLMLANRLVLQEALGKKWDQQPAVAAQLQQVRDSAIVELYLQAASAPPADYPSDADVQKTYDANRNAFLAPRAFELQQIFVAVPRSAEPAAEQAAKQKLDDIERKLKAPGADFAAIAKSSNDGQNAGELGWIPEPQIRPEIYAQLSGLAKNAVSEPVRLDDGWHILKLLDTKASYTRTLPEVREALVQRMRAERAALARRAYLAELLKQHPPVLNELALSSLFAKQAQ